MLELYHNAMSTCSQKVRFCLAEKGQAWTCHTLDLRAGDQHKPEYLALNPNGVVPTLVDDGEVIIESTIINEYLDERFPEPVLRPSDPAGRARMRIWTQQLDQGLHAETGVLSNAIAFRFQKLAKGEDFAHKLVEGIPDPAKRERSRSVVFEGVRSPLFAKSIARFRQTAGRHGRGLDRAPLARRRRLLLGRHRSGTLHHAPGPSWSPSDVAGTAPDRRLVQTGDLEAVL